MLASLLWVWLGFVVGFFLGAVWTGFFKGEKRHAELERDSDDSVPRLAGDADDAGLMDPELREFLRLKG